MRRKNPIARIAIANRRYVVGFGYIVIPSDVDRDQYVKNCFRVNLVDILTEDSEFVQDVKIDRGVLQSISFPERFGELGSLVVFVNENVNNQPFIIANLAKTDEYIDLKEHEFLLEKSTQEGLVLIKGKGDKGKLFFNLISSSDDINGIFIDIKNSSSKGVLNVEVQGDISLKVSKDLLLDVKEQIQGVIQQEVSIETKKDFILKADKFEITNQNNLSLKELFDDIITEISNITVQTSLGQMPILNKVQVESLKNKVAEILK